MRISDWSSDVCSSDLRWTDNLARRLQADPATRHLAIVNQGIGGNRLLHDGLGPNALARLDRDVLAQPGARFLILQIRRALCRERVCQYVLISVDVVILKKKTK